MAFMYHSPVGCFIERARVEQMSDSNKTSSSVNKKMKKTRKFHFIATKSNASKGVQPPEVKDGSLSIKKNGQTPLVRKPFKPDEVSSNWKNLAKVIKPRPEGSVQPYKKRKQQIAREQEVTKAVGGGETEEIWFDGVDPIVLESSSTLVQGGSNSKE